MRLPRMQGRPPHLSGSMVIRCSSSGFTSRIVASVQPQKHKGRKLSLPAFTVKADPSLLHLSTRDFFRARVLALERRVPRTPATLGMTTFDQEAHAYVSLSSFCDAKRDSSTSWPR